jgi:hypothetical protein
MLTKLKYLSKYWLKVCRFEYGYPTEQSFRNRVVTEKAVIRREDCELRDRPY